MADLDSAPFWATSLVNVTIADVRIGMPVRVMFHDLEGQDVTLALFEPS